MATASSTGLEGPPSRRLLASSLLVGLPAVLLVGGLALSWIFGASASAALVCAMVAVFAAVQIVGPRRGGQFAVVALIGLVWLWSAAMPVLGVGRALAALGGEVLALSSVFLLALSSRGVADRKPEPIEDALSVDPLTGLVSVRELDGRLDAEIVRNQRHGGNLALVFVETEGLQSVSRELGRSASNEVLGVLAARIGSITRSRDLAARVGGDGFRILLEAVAEPRNVPVYADRLLELLSESVDVAGATVNLGVRIGVALCPDDEADAEALMRAAESAVAGADRSGGVLLASALPAAHGARVH